MGVSDSSIIHRQGQAGLLAGDVAYYSGFMTPVAFSLEQSLQEVKEIGVREMGWTRSQYDLVSACLPV